jgi:hypothetical protein
MSDDEVDNDPRENDALYEYAKKAITDSEEVLQEFTKLMIPLTTGMITVYFALLKFLQIDNATSEPLKTIGIASVLLPEFLMIVSLVAFIVSQFPVRGRIIASNPKNIKLGRRVRLRWKYSWIIGGFSLFLAGIIAMGIVAIKLIFPSL